MPEILNWNKATKLLEHLRNQGGSPEPVVVNNSSNGSTCMISDSTFEYVKTEAGKLLDKAMAAGFQNFPIDRAHFKKTLLDEFVTKEKICAAITAKTGITEKNHNRVRKETMGEAISAEEAKKRGVFAKRIPLKFDCRNIDFKNSENYFDTDTCKDVTDECKGGMPAVMYAVPWSGKSAIAYLAKLTTASLYSAYDEVDDQRGPVRCTSKFAKSGDKVAYHALNVSAVYTLDFIMRAIDEDNWSAWTLLKECTDSKGEKISYDDLMFDFGVRIFVDVPVKEDGIDVAYSITLTSVAAASNNPLSGIITLEKAFKRYMAGETTKKILLESKAKGWQKK